MAPLKKNLLVALLAILLQQVHSVPVPYQLDADRALEPRAMAAVEQGWAGAAADQAVDAAAAAADNAAESQDAEMQLNARTPNISAASRKSFIESILHAIGLHDSASMAIATDAINSELAGTSNIVTARDMQAQQAQQNAQRESWTAGVGGALKRLAGLGARTVDAEAQKMRVEGNAAEQDAIRGEIEGQELNIGSIAEGQNGELEARALERAAADAGSAGAVDAAGAEAQVQDQALADAVVDTEQEGAVEDAANVEAQGLNEMGEMGTAQGQEDAVIAM